MKLKPGSTEVGVAVTLLNLSRKNSFGKEILATLGLEPLQVKFWFRNKVSKVRDESSDDRDIQIVFVIESAGVEGESTPTGEKPLSNPLPFSKLFFRFVIGGFEDA